MTISNVVQYSALPQSRLELLFELAQQYAHLDGALVQCGVYNGGSAAVLASALGKRPVWLFDSFEGLPQPSEADGGRAKWKMEKHRGKWQVGNPANVQAAFRELGIWGHQVHIVKGWFAETFPVTDTGPIAVLHLDADWYDSTKIALDTFYDRVAPGGLIIVDDFGHWRGCQQAVHEFWDRRRISPQFVKLDVTCGYWIKDGKMTYRGTPDGMLDQIAQQYPGLKDVFERSNGCMGARKTKREIATYQAGFLYALARQYNYPGAHILEIGTALGFSASIISQAAFNAHITTLNPRTDEADQARLNLRTFPNVKVVAAASWDYLKHYKQPLLEMIFVDGDHNAVRRDLPWFNLLRPGGLMVFHDYAPAGTYRACPPVFEALNDMAATLGRDFDVSCIDDGGVGMVGFYRREGETWRG